MLCLPFMGSVRAPSLGLLSVRIQKTAVLKSAIFRDAMRHHLQKYHKLPRSVVRSVRLAASRLSAEFPATHPLREKYKSGGGRHGCLPKIDGLPMLWCKECPTCLRLFAGDEGLRKHCSRMHDGISRAEVRALEKVPCQSLASYRAEGAPFRVVVQDYAGPSSETIDAVTAALSSYDPGNVAEAANMPTSDREVSSFVSLAKCVLRLEAHGLTLEQAAALIRAPDTRSEAKLCDVYRGILAIFGEARDMCKELGNFRHFLMCISTTGVYEKKKPFRFLINDEQGDTSSERYARSAQIVVLVACRIYEDADSYPKVTMTPSVKESVATFLSTCGEEDPEQYQMSLHRLLWSIFSEPGGLRSGALSLFSSVVCACLCTTTDRGAAARFSTGTITGSRLSGIVYSVSCCAALEVLEYSPEETRDEVRDQVKKCLSGDATVGVTNFVDLPIHLRDSVP